jgi:uncharacterized protein YdhG (YjbR/CyaY superfamily)
MQNLDLESLKIKELPPTWPKGFFTFSLIIFLIALGSYFGLEYWNKNQDSKLIVLEEEFQTLRSSFALEQEEEVILFEKKLNILSKLLTNHIYFSKVLLVLEELTHPEIYYTSLNFSTDKNMLILVGIAKNQMIFSEAVSGLINNSDKIKSVVVKDIKVTTNKNVAFSLDVFIQPDLLKYQQDDGNY